MHIDKHTHKYTHACTHTNITLHTCPLAGRSSGIHHHHRARHALARLDSIRLAVVALRLGCVSRVMRVPLDRSATIVVESSLAIACHAAQGRSTISVFDCENDMCWSTTRQLNPRCPPHLVSLHKQPELTPPPSTPPPQLLQGGQRHQRLHRVPAVPAGLRARGLWGCECRCVPWLAVQCCARRCTRVFHHHQRCAVPKQRHIHVRQRV